MSTDILKQSSDPVSPAKASASKPVSPDRPKLSTKEGGLPKGIKLACKKSQQIAGHYYIPSHENFAGFTKLSNCIVANGCGINLFAVDSDEHLVDIFKTYPVADYNIKLMPSRSTSGGSNVIVIRRKGKMKFSVRLAVDMFEDAVCEIPALRFHLSSKCAKLILNAPELLSRINTVDHEDLKALADSAIPRMPISLLGNLTLDCFDMIKVGGGEQPVLFLVNFQEVDLDRGAMYDLSVDVHAALGKMDQETINALEGYDALEKLTCVVDPDADF